MTGRPGLYLDDKEIAKQLGVSVAEWAVIASRLARVGLPAPDLLFGNRRYWPAVKAFLDRRYGLEAPLPLKPNGKEHLEA